MTTPMHELDRSGDGASAENTAIPAIEELAIGPDRRVSDLVYYRLRSAIVTGYFEAGSRIVERDLTELLRVSRTPIREALQRLARDQLVNSYPHRGYYVRKPTFDEARQAYEYRRVIESACGELAADRATREDIDAMRAAVAEGARLLAHGDRATLLLSNNRFHHLQAHASHNMFLERELAVIWTYVDLLRGRFWASTDRPTEGHVEHEEMIEAIARRDPGRARHLNELHVQRAWESVASRFAQGAA